MPESIPLEAVFDRPSPRFELIGEDVFNVDQIVAVVNTSDPNRTAIWTRTRKFVVSLSVAEVARILNGDDE